MLYKPRAERTGTSLELPLERFPIDCKGVLKCVGSEQQRES